MFTAVLVIATVVALGSMLSTGRATSGGSPYDVPFATDTNPDPNVFETTLTADEATVDIGNGVSAHAQAYNGSIPGPTFQLKVGDTVIVHFENHIDKPTGIHWHGIEVPNAMDGTPLTKNQVAPGGTFLYKFTVTRPGIYWYHPHHHSSTNQVFKGLYGMILVRDPNEAALQASGVLPSAAQTRPIVLSDTTVCKNPPGNDATTYTAASGQHVSGAALPAQGAPYPKTLCETPGALNEEGDPGPAFAAGDIPNIQKKNAGQSNEGQTVLTNGKNVGARGGGPTQEGATGAPGPGPPGAVAAGASKLDVQPGQGLRLQILNAATVRYMRLRLTRANGDKISLFRVGGEAGLLNKAVLEGNVLLPPGAGIFNLNYYQGETLIPPGSRADVVAAIPVAAAGEVLTLWTEDYARVGGGGFSNIPTVPVMHLNVTGAALPQYAIADGTDLRQVLDPVPTLGPATGALLNPAVFVPAKDGEVSQNIALTTVGAGGPAGINGKKGEHDFPGDYSDAPHIAGSSRYAKEGDLLQLTVQNTTTAHHPFHLHGFSIQPRTLTQGGNTYTYPTEFRDNVDVPGGATLTFRVKLDGRPLADGTTPGGAVGRWVFHCHIFFHAVGGMISELVITAPNGNERPDVNVAGTSVQVNQGDTATISGTFKDRDGDPVTLTSSVGTVAKDSATGWTWTYPTGTDTSKLVYVTATDSNGLKSQMLFSLSIVNRGAPALVLPGAQRVGTGNLLSFGISATDPDAVDPIALGASGLPSAMTVTDNGNRIGTASGRATGAPGSYVAVFAANDGKHLPTFGTVPITVSPFAVVVDRPERLVNRAITVGCRYYSNSIRTCTPTVLRGTRAVGRATTRLRRSGRRFASVRVPLSAAVRRLVASSLGGVAVSVRATGVKFGSRASSTETEGTTVVAPRVVARPSLAAFQAGGATLTSRAQAYLAGLARTVGSASRIICTAHPDGAGAALAGSRAAAACTALRAAGLSARYSSAGVSRPRNRRIEIAILR